MSKRFFLCILALLFSSTAPLRANDAGKKLDLFWTPWPMHISYDKADHQHFYPLVPNPIHDCLQGNIYNVKGMFETFAPGFHFEKRDFAWFSPESNLLAVYASAKNMKLISEVLAGGSYDPPMNVDLDAKISISRPMDAKIGPEETMGFKLSTHSGQRNTTSSVSMLKPTEPGYAWEFETVVNADGKIIDCNMVLKVTYAGHEYAVTTSFSILCNKAHTLLIGTTPDKREITFRITPTVNWLYQVSPLDDPKNKDQLLKRIKRELALH